MIMYSIQLRESLSAMKSLSLKNNATYRDFISQENTFVKYVCNLISKISQLDAYIVYSEVYGDDIAKALWDRNIYDVSMEVGEKIAIEDIPNIVRRISRDIDFYVFGVQNEYLVIPFEGMAVNIITNREDIDITSHPSEIDIVESDRDLLDLEYFRGYISKIFTGSR